MSPLGVLAPLCIEIDLATTRQRHGAVYFLLSADEIVYVGQTTNIEQRISLHATDPRWGVKEFNRAIWMPVPIDRLDAYEGALIRALRPRHNRRSPAYRGGDNEILIALGLQPHVDESAAALAWSEHAYVPRSKAS